jgi:hypothetical protein
MSVESGLQLMSAAHPEKEQGGGGGAGRVSGTPSGLLIILYSRLCCFELFEYMCVANEYMC